jgi:hypothetical protein
MVEGEAEEDDAADADPVLSEVTSGIVPSAGEVVSGTVGSVRAGGSEGRGRGASSSLSAVTNAHPATAETSAVASAHAQVSTCTTTRSPLGIPSSNRSGRNTVNAPRSTAETAKSVTPTVEVGISIIRPRSYATWPLSIFSGTSETAPKAKRVSQAGAGRRGTGAGRGPRQASRGPPRVPHARFTGRTSKNAVWTKFVKHVLWEVR